MSRFVPILQELVGNGRLEFEKLIDQGGTLFVTLTNADGHRVELRFESYVAFRKLDEGDALRLLSAMRRSGDTSRCFYRVDESNFLAWFNAERCGESSGQAPLHYLIAATNDIIDVLALDPPIVE